MSENLTIEKKMKYFFALEKIVKGVGRGILGLRAQGFNVFDTRDYKGHESSSVDTFARERMQALIDQYLPDFEGTLRFELQPY